MNTVGLAQAFAKTYYTRLSQAPELVHRFYASDSTLIHGTEGEATSPSSVTTGQEAIKSTLAESQIAGTQYLIRDIAAAPTIQNCLLVTVLGERAKPGSPVQRFVQTFVLKHTENNAYYILNDVLRVFNLELDRPVDQATGAEAVESSSPSPLKDSEAEPAREQSPKPSATAPVNPNSWAAILAKPQQPAPPPKAMSPAPAANAASPKISMAGAVVGAAAEAPPAAPPKPGPHSAFLKLSSTTAFTKQTITKALAQFGPLSKFYLDASKKRAYVDFPNQRVFDQALKTSRVKVAGTRETIDILRRFTGPPKPNVNGGAATTKPMRQKQ